TAPSAVPTSFSFRKALVDKVPVLRVQLQGINGAERDDDDDDDDDEEEIAKIDEPEDTESGGGDDEDTESDGESEEEETREEEEESFDPIPKTLEDSEDDGNDEEDQGLRVSEEQRLIEEEEAYELYRDVDINQGRRLQLSADIEESHVTLTSINPDGQQESSSVSWLRCPYPFVNHVHMFMKLHYWTLTLVVSQTSAFVTGASSLILSSSRCFEILDYVANLLVISGLYSARSTMVRFALVAQR
nr:hypothetical protein [Tanacetum cinerariifolium]